MRGYGELSEMHITSCDYLAPSPASDELIEMPNFKY